MHTVLLQNSLRFPIVPPQATELFVFFSAPSLTMRANISSRKETIAPCSSFLQKNKEIREDNIVCIMLDQTKRKDTF